MKSSIIYGCLTLAMLYSPKTIWAQEAEGEESKMKVVVIKDDNGKIQEFKKEFDSADQEELEKFLKDKGVDMKIREIQSDGKDGKEVVYEYKIETEDDGGEKKVVIMKMDKQGEDVDIETIIEESIQMRVELDSASSELKAIMGEGFDLKWEFDSTNTDFKVIKMNCNMDGANMNQVFVFDDGTLLEDAMKETNSFVFIKRKSTIDPNDEVILGTKITEEKLGDLPVENLSMYPNPSDGNFRTEFSVVEESDVLITITDTKGAIIHEKELNSFQGRHQEDLDLSKEQSGLYFYNIKIGDQLQSKKILLQ